MQSFFPEFSFPFGGAKIDSFRVLVPLSHVSAYPDSLDNSAHLVTLRQTTGEVLNVKSPKFFIPLTPGSKYASDVPFSVEKKNLFGNGFYLEFVLTSYTCSDEFNEQSYFAGCTQKGVNRFFAGLSEFGFFFKPGFLQVSKIFDVDIALDFRFLQGDVTSLVKRLKASQKAENVGTFVHCLEKYNNEKVLTGGYQFARKGFPFSKVFFKLYDKYIYSVKKGRFSPLLQDSLKGIYRFEFTIKNSGHLNHLLSSGRSQRQFTFLDLFMNSELVSYLFQCVFIYQFSGFFNNKNLKSDKKDISLQGKDLLIKFLCDKITDGEVQKHSELIADFLNSDVFSRVHKTRFKKLLIDLF